MKVWAYGLFSRGPQKRRAQRHKPAGATTDEERKERKMRATHKQNLMAAVLIFALAFLTTVAGVAYYSAMRESDDQPTKDIPGND
jgi:hypothetical protein